MAKNKLKELTPKLKKNAILENLENIPESFFEFASNGISNYSLNETKIGITADVSPRALNRWIIKEVVYVENSDKGKIKRFNRLESIWVKIVVKLRRLGVSLDDLKYIRTQLFNYTVEEFCLFKFKVLNVILEAPEYLIIDDDHGVGFYSYKDYSDKAAKGHLYDHINLRFIDYIREEFPNNNFGTNFGIREVDEDVEKVTLLFYLKTNDFEEMRITLSDGDTRLITNSSELKLNKSLLKTVQNWEFKSISIQVNDEVKFSIEN